MPAVFRTTRIVEFGDTDMAGIVHFANFFRYMEAAEHAFLRSLGLSVVMEYEGAKYGLPRVSASCDYLRPARFGETLTITVAVEKLGRSSITYAFDFTRDDEAIARGRVTAVFCRFDEGRPKACEMPEAFRAKLEAPMVE
ncbi:MAG TPA: acyl-CoA thioesterase [Planctomycetales bacterium]|jgi:YbgC/YbaW family acyl-CoA thioester hydrolase|nr:acyl-CoA thioesterase [Planctomycetales bacterium]